jgi:hypothetical protein
MTIAHTGIKVAAAQHAAVVAWYEAALASIGYKNAMSFAEGQVVGFADSAGHIDWWITAANDATAVLPTHTAFVATGSYSNTYIDKPYYLGLLLITRMMVRFI